MLSRDAEAVHRRRVHRRQDNRRAPCPRGNGTTIGTVQDFTVLCNTNLDGEVLHTLDAFDFRTCLDICSSYHPRCEGASFDGSRCSLKAGLRPDERRFALQSDSGIGAFPGASSNCPTLGESQEALGTNFTIMCGFIIAGSDMTQNYAPTFQDCLGQCSATTGCSAVSFDPSQDMGFKNCYLKTKPENPSDIAPDRRTDSAIVAARGVPPAAGSAATSVVGPGVTTIPLSPSPDAGGGGAVFFTPPGNPATQGDATGVATLLSSSPSAGATLPLSLPGPGTTAVSSAGAVPDATGQGAADTPPSMAWVAAPVVGGVAAITLIAVSFVMLRRRRRGSEGGQRPGPASGSGASSWAAFLTAWLPAAWTSRRGDQGSPGRRGRKMRGIGNFSEVEAGRMSVEVRASMRNSVLGFVTGRPAGMERLEDIQESEGKSVRSGELRNSLNGLGQNKWSQ